MSDDEIVAAAVTMHATDTSESEGEGEGDDLLTMKRVPLQTALDSVETLMVFLEQEDDSDFSDILMIRKIRMNIRKFLGDVHWNFYDAHIIGLPFIKK